MCVLGEGSPHPTSVKPEVSGGPPRWGSPFTPRRCSASCFPDRTHPLLGLAPVRCTFTAQSSIARWAAVYGVAQSRTWLKWLSSMFPWKQIRNWCHWRHPCGGFDIKPEDVMWPIYVKGLKQDLPKTACKGPLPRGWGAVATPQQRGVGTCSQCGRAGLPVSAGPQWRRRKVRLLVSEGLSGSW